MLTRSGPSGPGRGVRLSRAEALAVRLWEACGFAVEKA